MEKAEESESKPIITRDTFYLLFILVLFFMAAGFIFEAGYVSDGLMLLVVVAGLTALLLRIRWDEQRSRKLALKQGLMIERVLHDPTFFDPQHEYGSADSNSQSYKKHLAYSYSMHHRFIKAATWALLMPEVEAKAEYPNGWKLVVKQGNISDELRQTINKIAKDELWKRNPVWLEINSYPDKICAVWDESNWKMADRLFDMLSKMSEKAE